MANTFLHAMERRRRQVAVREVIIADDRKRSVLNAGGRCRAATSSCPPTSWWPTKLRRRRRDDEWSCRSMPCPTDMDDPRCGRRIRSRLIQERMDADGDRWSGTARSAPSRSSPSTRRPCFCAQHAARRTGTHGLVTVAGGGDTVAALNAKAGVADDFTYVSTAGGAFLEWMEGKDAAGRGGVGEVRGPSVLSRSSSSGPVPRTSR